MLAEPPFSLLRNLDAVDEALDFNAEIAEKILANGLAAFGLSNEPGYKSLHNWRDTANSSDITKVHTTIRQFYRDWSREGQLERMACYGPIIRDIQAYHICSVPVVSNDCFKIKVLVPGAGLGRLVYELCMSGFDVEGNEISYHQLLASSWILNHVQPGEQYRLYPFASQFTNLQSRRHQLQQVLIPDVHPGECIAERMSQGRTVGEMKMTAADFVVLYNGKDHEETFDAVATVFFVDTAPNIIRYIQTIHHCLRKGGIWTNLGPLLWHFDDRAPKNVEQEHDGRRVSSSDEKQDDMGIGEPGSFELTEEETIELVKQMGFQIEYREVRGDGVGYIQNPQSMLQNLYHVSHWAARKM